MSYVHERRGDNGATRTGCAVSLLVALDASLAAFWAWITIGDGGLRVFCGEFPTQGCLQQMNLFAAASLIPAALALILMVAAFVTPGMRDQAGLRAQTLGYSLIAWLIAGFTYVLGGLPAI